MSSSEQNLKEKIRSWSKNRKDERSELFAFLELALDNAELKSRLSLIDIRKEVEVRSDGRTKRINLILNIISVFYTASYLAPVGFTWFHLSKAMGEFRNAVDRLASGDSLNFLSFWTGAETSSYSGMKLQTVGLYIVLFLAFPIVLNFFLNYFESKEGKMSADLNDLILQTQLEFSTARTITPEALADALSDSTTKLETALGQMSTAVKSTEGTIDAIGKSAKSLENATTKSSGALADASSALQTQIKNLDTTFGAISEVVRNLSTIGGDIASAGQTIKAIGKLADSATQLESKMITSLDSASGAANSLSEVTSSLQTNIGALGDQLTDQVKALSSMIEKLSVTISPFVSNLKALGQITDDNKPAILHFGDVVVATKKVVDQMNSVVENFAEAANSISTMNSK
jgi:hypothetical protein